MQGRQAVCSPWRKRLAEGGARRRRVRGQGHARKRMPRRGSGCRAGWCRLPLVHLRCCTRGAALAARPPPLRREICRSAIAHLLVWLSGGGLVRAVIVRWCWCRLCETDEVPAVDVVQLFAAARLEASKQAFGQRRGEPAGHTRKKCAKQLAVPVGVSWAPPVAPAWRARSNTCDIAATPTERTHTNHSPQSSARSHCGIHTLPRLTLDTHGPLRSHRSQHQCAPDPHRSHTSHPHTQGAAVTALS